MVIKLPQKQKDPHKAGLSYIQLNSLFNLAVFNQPLSNLNRI